MPRLFVLAFATLALVPATAVRAGGEKDPLQVNTVWRGEIRQDNDSWPTVMIVRSRDGQKITGEVHFSASSGLCKLSFIGTVDGNIIAWMTDRIDGNVTYPGIYLARIHGTGIAGTWHVPSARQFGRFTLKQAER